MIIEIIGSSRKIIKLRKRRKLRLRLILRKIRASRVKRGEENIKDWGVREVKRKGSMKIRHKLRKSFYWRETQIEIAQNNYQRTYS